MFITLIVVLHTYKMNAYVQIHQVICIKHMQFLYINYTSKSYLNEIRDGGGISGNSTNLLPGPVWNLQLNCREIIQNNRLNTSWREAL